ARHSSCGGALAPSRPATEVGYWQRASSRSAARPDGSLSEGRAAARAVRPPPARQRRWRRRSAVGSCPTTTDKRPPAAAAADAPSRSPTAGRGWPLSLPCGYRWYRTGDRRTWRATFLMSTAMERKSRSRPHAVNRDGAWMRACGRGCVRSIDCRPCRPIVRDIPDHRRPTLHASGTKGRHHMQFGVQFFPAVDHTDKSAADYYAESLAIAQEAETLGFTHARTVEHYFTRYGGYSPHPIVFLTAVSQRTKTLRLLTRARLPVFHHPFNLAREIAMLAGISGGRLDVGFARAFLPHEFRRFGISPDESHARFREGLEQIELLLTQENASHRGRFHSFENVTSLPRPTQRPRPKFYIAATQTPESFEFAGSKGYALMAIPIGPIGPLIELYRKAWRAAGHPGDGEVMVAFHMFCH